MYNGVALVVLVEGEGELRRGWRKVEAAAAAAAPSKRSFLLPPLGFGCC